jgi:hypothetical protein
MGSYSCVVTDFVGCQQQVWVYVPQTISINYNSTVNNATCLQTNGTVTSFVTGGTAPYTFLWSNLATTQNLTNVAAGTYQVQIIDANGCMGQGWVNVSASTPITVVYNVTPSSCTSATGGATVTPSGGAIPYTIVWYTFPNQTNGPSISNKPPGTYAFKVTDANGCIRTGAATIPPNSTINANLSNASVFCPATTGALGMQVTGTSPPFTYLWSNAATTATITNAPLGTYVCTVTDNAGCKVVKAATIYTISSIQVGMNVTHVTCKFSANGAITANALGGTSPYSYAWSNNMSGSSITGLAMGQYWVTVTDASGCKKSAMATVGNAATSNSCYCTITGTVYNDANLNCTRNSGENGIASIPIHVTGGFGYAFTNSNGVYSVQVPTGTYTVAETVQQFYPLAPCQTNNQVVAASASANCVLNVNFANTVVPISDLRINAWNITPPIPGNTCTQRLVVHNDGTQSESTIKIGYKHDGQLMYNGSSPWTFSQLNSTSAPNWYSIMSGFTTLQPNQWSQTNISYSVATNVPLSTIVNYHDTVAKTTPISTQWLTDNTPWNNVCQHSAMVVGSFDPNFKEVSPAGTGTNGGIYHKDSVLTYAVHFQNTGSWYAQNIVVIDTLDPNVRMTSMKPGYATHSYRTEMSDNGVVKFIFPNINLAYKSAYGDALSSGMVTYSIRMKKNLPVGTKIRNKAAIYFDYNEPIITNTTLNTIIQGTVDALNEFANGGSAEGTIYPNPADDRFTLLFNATESSTALLTVYDISGRAVTSRDVKVTEGANGVTENASSLTSGVYIVQIKTESALISKKLVIAR